MHELEIAKIKINPRFRKDLGDIKSLAQNIEEIGLLHPIVVNEKNELIAGRRRIKAYKHLGRDTIPTTIVSMDDVRKGEIAENRERKDFMVMEMKAIYDYLHPLLEAEAKKRQEATQLVGKGVQRQDADGGGNLPQPIDIESGKTRDKIASYLGVSGRTLDKIITIADEGKPEEIQEVDSQNRMISKVYNKIKKRKNLEHAHQVGTPDLPKEQYDIILADPPWRYYSESSQRGKADNHYATMTTEDICGLQVQSADNALLFMWSTNAHLEDAFRVLKAWGFEYVTNYVWVKDKIGLGWFARGQHELLLLARKGKMPYPEDHNRYSTVIEAQRNEHSAKPEIVYEMIETMYPNRRYLELFSRNHREGWQMWGLETDKKSSQDKRTYGLVGLEGLEPSAFGFPQLQKLLIPRRVGFHRL